MFIDAIKNGHLAWGLLILWLSWPLAFVYMIAIYKKSPFSELILKPLRKSYKTDKKEVLKK
jgi:hypothetical protein